MAFERISVDPTRMGGVPCIRDLRVTVSLVLGQLAAGVTVDQLLTDYPYLERADVTAALEYASAIVNEQEVQISRPAGGYSAAQIFLPRWLTRAPPQRTRSRTG